MRTQTKIVSNDYTGLIPLADAKEYLRFDGTDQDVILPVLINASIKLAEAYTQQSFGNKNIIVEFIGLETLERVKLPLGYHRTVNSVSRVDEDGTETVLTLNDDYTVTGLNQKFIRILSATFSTVNVDSTPSYRVDYDAGPAVPATVDDGVKNAIYKILSDSFDNRENSITGMSVADLSQDAKLMLNDFRLK